MTGDYLSAAYLIATTREQKGYQQKQMAAKMEVSPQYLHDLENKRRKWTPELLTKAARILALDEDYLFLLCGRIPPAMQDRLATMPYTRVRTAWRRFRKEVDS